MKTRKVWKNQTFAVCESTTVDLKTLFLAVFKRDTEDLKHCHVVCDTLLPFYFWKDIKHHLFFFQVTILIVLQFF